MLHYRSDKVRLKVSTPYLVIADPALRDTDGKVTDRRNTFRAGFGDTTLGLTYSLPVAADAALDLSAKVKLPTAPEAAGISTRTTDITVVAELSRWFGSAGASARVGRRLNGSGGPFDLEDVWSAGVSAYTLVGAAALNLNLDWHESSFVGSPDIVEFSGGVSGNMGRRFRLQGYGYIANVGRRTDVGIGTQVVFRFGG